MSEANRRVTGYYPYYSVGNLSVMAALGAGGARTTRPHRYAQALDKGHGSYEKNITPLFSSLLIFLSHTFSSSTPLSLSLSLHQLNTMNYDFHLRIIEVLCLHLSRSTPLRKAPTIDHYLHRIIPTTLRTRG